MSTFTSKVLCALALVLLQVLSAHSQQAASTENVAFAVTGANGVTDYIINGQNDPAFTLFRGSTYTFNNAVSGGHPLYIKNASGVTGSTANVYSTGVTGAGTATVVFTVPMTAPDTLYYQCSLHTNMFGTLTIKTGGVFTVSGNNGVTDYTFNPGGNDPTLEVEAGNFYKFNLQVNTNTHPFYLKSSGSSSGTNDIYSDGVTGAGNSSELTWEVPTTAPSKLWYQCSAHAAMLGVITVNGGLLASAAESVTYSITGANGVTDYTFATFGNDPAFTLLRGSTYIFNNAVSGSHPLYIKTASGVTGTTANVYSSGVTGAGSATVTFTVPTDAPDTLFYQCSLHTNMWGRLNIKTGGAWTVSGNDGTSSYVFNNVGGGTVKDPTLAVVRGQHYKFDLQVNTAVHPFFLKTSGTSSGTNDLYTDGVTGGNMTSSLSWDVAGTAPSILWYQCSAHAAMIGRITVSGTVSPASVTVPTLLSALVLLVSLVLYA